MVERGRAAEDFHGQAGGTRWLYRAELSGKSYAREGKAGRPAGEHQGADAGGVGKQDKLLPIGAGERYAAGIAGAKMVSFEKCGHVPPMEKTEKFLTAVIPFLRGGAPPLH